MDTTKHTRMKYTARTVSHMQKRKGAHRPENHQSISTSCLNWKIRKNSKKYKNYGKMWQSTSSNTDLLEKQHPRIEYYKLEEQVKQDTIKALRRTL